MHTPDKMLLDVVYSVFTKADTNTGHDMLQCGVGLHSYK